jgi:5-(carboxyamino)imidazole ribonucleotide mutase
MDITKNINNNINNINNINNTNNINNLAQVAMIMGSNSDWPTLKKAYQQLQNFGINVTAQVISAHRMPLDMVEFATKASQNNIHVIIAAAGGAAHLPGMVASMTTIPVLGVPIASKHLKGVDSLYSIVQMPSGIPVATFAIGEAGAMNAGLFAASLLQNHPDYPDLKNQLIGFRQQQTQKAQNMPLDFE